MLGITCVVPHTHALLPSPSALHVGAVGGSCVQTDLRALRDYSELRVFRRQEPARRSQSGLWQRAPLQQPVLRMSGAGASSGGALSPVSEKLAAFLGAQFLPLGLLLAVVVGLSYPAAGVAVGQIPITKYAASGIFLIGGLKLRTDEAREALRDVKSIVFGVVSILFFTVVVGARLARWFPLSVPEFTIGLSLFMCMPCTISSGAGLAVQAGGNFALALMLTVICSTVGVFTVPVMLDQFAGFGGNIKLPVAQMIQKLVVTVLVPIALGKAIASSSQTAKTTIKNVSSPLTYLSHMFIIITPWIQISNTALKGTFATVALFDLLAVVSAAAFLHMVFLVMNYCGTKLIGLSEDMCKSVVFVASSKTLPLALTILTILPPGLGDKGLIALPCILGHFSQIVMDSFIVAAWKTPADSAQTK